MANCADCLYFKACADIGEYMTDEYIKRTSVNNDVRDLCYLFTDKADFVEVKYGEWQATEAYPHWFCCSVCHRRFVPNDEWIDRYNIPINYCPNCGAKMDGGKAE